MILQIPAREDNYIFILRDDPSNTTVVIDPTEHQPVLDLCFQNHWHITAILITHHHPDHIYGIKKIEETFQPTIWGYTQDQHRLPPLTNPLPPSTSFSIGNFKIIAQHTPGHTLGHMSYYFPELQALFCGDTLFSMGCGRLFEGSPEMMLKSLNWIRALPEETTVYCSHEYTQTNTEFAMSLDPQNEGLKAYYKNVLKKRAQNAPTIPMALKTETALNPFLRWDDKNFKTELGIDNLDSIDTLAYIRRLRDRW